MRLYWWTHGRTIQSPRAFTVYGPMKVCACSSSSADAIVSPRIRRRIFPGASVRFSPTPKLGFVISRDATDVGKLITMLVRKSLNAFVVDLVRVRPAAEPGAVEWEPAPENRYRWLQRLDLNTIIDVGAHVGEFAMMIHEILPSAAIISFEPQEAAFVQL